METSIWEWGYCAHFSQCTVWLADTFGCSEEILTVAAMLQVQNVFLQPSKQKATAVSSSCFPCSWLISHHSSLCRRQPGGCSQCTRETTLPFSMSSTHSSEWVTCLMWTQGCALDGHMTNESCLRRVTCSTTRTQNGARRIIFTTRVREMLVVALVVYACLAHELLLGKYQCTLSPA